ncbi:MAG: TolC family protein [Polyangia bacterium]
MNRLALCAAVLVGVLGGNAALADEIGEPDRTVLSVSLNEAIVRALRWHPRDREVVATVDHARARFEAERAGSLPTFTFQFEHIWEDSRIGPGGVHDPLDLNQIAVISNVPIVDGRAWANWQEAQDRLDVSVADAMTSRRAIGLAAARAWIEAAAVAHALAVEREGLRTARDHERFVRGRLDSGAATSLDLVRASKEIAVASALVDRARAAQIRACELLGLLTGASEPLDADLDDDHPLSDPLKDGDEPVPDIVAAKEALNAARKEVRNMFTDYLPALHAEVIGFFQDHPQPELPVTGIGYACFMRLTLPLYDGGLREATLRSRRAERLRSEAHLDDVTRIITVERRDGESDVRRLRAALEETKDAADLARKALDLSQSRYASGKGTQLEVIYALRESRDADIAVAAAEEVWRRATLDLLAARGLVPSGAQLRNYRNH